MLPRQPSRRGLTMEDMMLFVDFVRVRTSPGGDKLSPVTLLAITFLLNENRPDARARDPDAG
jgi:hypothetical protein